ncbi:MAG: PhzF family phenazine biosynthesis protein [Candidatus Babeliales bacterium]
MNIQVHIVKAFTHNTYQGNPAGIIFDADDLNDQQMKNITALTQFSECAFIQRSQVANVKIRFFTALQEVDLCGHATIAAFYLIAKKFPAGFRCLTQETRAGILPVYCHPNGIIQMEQKSPEFIDHIASEQEIAQLLNISTSSITGPIQIVSTGTPKLLIPIDTLTTLCSISPHLDGISAYCRSSGARGFYAFTHQTLESSSNFHARQFNPLAGINEDPITGIAAGGLAAYAQKHKLLREAVCVIEQGHCLGKFGKMTVTMKDKILVGGYAVSVGIKTYII